MRLSKAVALVAESETPGRIRQIDFIRAVSLWTVVVSHAFMGVVVWEPEVELNNLLAIYPNLQWLSWILQVMPLFFIAGAAANQISFQSSQQRLQTYGVWVYRRVIRLLAPVFWYLGAIILAGWLSSLFVEAASVEIFFNLATQLLWFLGIYVLMTAATPLWILLSRHIIGTIIFGLIAIGLVDQIRQEIPTFGLLNFWFGWGLISVLGMKLLRELKARSLSNRSLISIVFVVLSMELILVAHFDYPVSLVGLPGADFSNMAPPSLLLVLHGIVQTAIWLLLADRIENFSHRKSIWSFTLNTNLAAMTIYLWHLPLIMVSHLVLRMIAQELPTPDPEAFDTFYLLQLSLLIAGIISLVYFWAQYAYLLENLLPPIPKPNGAPPLLSRLLASFGSGLTAIALLMFSVVGPLGFPNRVGVFGGVNWSNGFAIGLFGTGLIMIWGGAKSHRPKIN